MYSPKELEGEVDHSFFDSDCEEHGKERGDNAAVSGRNTEVRAQVEVVVSREGNCLSNEAQSKEAKGDCSVEEDRSRPSSTSSLLSFEEQSEADDELDKNRSTHVQITTKIPSGLSAEENGKDNDEDDDEDGYKRSDEDTEEEPDQKPPKSKVANHCLPKKSSGKFRSGKHSPGSSSKSDSSYTSPEDSSASESSPQRKRACSPPYRAKLGALARREKLRLPPEESEDTVTDVTPLSTPDISPVQSFELALRKEGERERVIVRQQNVLGGLAADDVGSVSEAFLSVSQQLERELVLETSGRRPRKNFSFSNDEVARIDRENQRLLRELTRRSPRSPRPRSTPLKKPSSPPVRMCHSALNRQREQLRIERENVAFLKRLESAKPTPGMKRAEQLSDYQRQARYLGATSPSKLERTGSSRSSAGKSSRVSSASSLHRARPASSVSTAVSKASRTAWP
ncbi:cilia- and flagella-associated protein 97 [Conger conger]|uniref:cilia- and flagella-associated protein 97 n=1 Tax=Conger conger TaxID=82655 RepID=UPI002A5A298C|nr:cilia- and flagella-associated protein 97 [Conger conger]XP_061107138.1 cilia- and flagella-associated protein 97 [Conger conger]